MRKWTAWRWRRPNRPLLILAAGHGVIDFYEQLLPPLLPFLVVALALNNTLAGALVSVYAITALLLQPLLGSLVDRHPYPWLIGASLLWAGALFAVVGLVPSYWGLLVLAAVAGVSNALFHPLAALAVRRVSGGQGSAMALWATAGNLGVASAPVFVATVIGTWGLGASWVFLFPGLLFGLVVFRTLRIPSEDDPATESIAGGGQVPAATFASLRNRPVQLLCCSAFLRLWTLLALITFLPLYYVQHLATSQAFGGYVLSMVLFGGAVTTLVGGYWSDRHGRRPITIVPLLVAAPVLLTAVHVGVAASVPLFMLGGALTMLPHSVNVVQIQELMPRQEALAAGMVLGLSGGAASLALVMIGALADAWHLQGALGIFLALLALASALVALGVPETLKRPS